MVKQKPINWKLYVLAGYLLAQLTPQVRVSIQEKDGWYWPSVKLGYDGEFEQIRVLEYQLDNAKENADTYKGLMEYYSCLYNGGKDCRSSIIDVRRVPVPSSTITTDPSVPKGLKAMP